MGLAGTDAPLTLLQPHLVAVGLGCATFLVANHVLAGVAAALLAREPVGRYLVSDLSFQGLTALCVLALTPVVVASGLESMTLVPLCVLPLLAIYVGARQAARDAHRAMHDSLTGLPNLSLIHI